MASEEPQTNESHCQICGQNKETEEVSPGTLGQGLICGPVPLCDFCAEFVSAPHQDGCLVCGTEDTHFSFEIEGVTGSESLDVHYSGSLCSEHSHELIYKLQSRAMDLKDSDAVEDDEVVSA